MQDFMTFISKHPEFSVPIAIIFLFLLIVEFLRSKRRQFAISPAQATQLINHENAVIVDLRPNDAYRKGHIINALSLTPQDIRENGKKIEKFKNRPILLVCPAGLESQKVAAILLKQGYNAHSLTGGMRGWLDAKMPVVKE